MTKTTLLAAITAKYLAVGTPQLQDSINGVNWYIVNVCGAGLAADGSPIASRSNLSFYVYHETLGDEAAYYYQQPLQNGCDALSTSSTGGQAYFNLFSSAPLRQRVLGAQIKAATAYIQAGVVNQNLHWAQDFAKSTGKYTDAFMMALSNNTAIRAAGNAVLDADLETALLSYLPTIATIFGIA